jgi:hypothetical protein
MQKYSREYLDEMERWNVTQREIEHGKTPRDI